MQPSSTSGRSSSCTGRCTVPWTQRGVGSHRMLRGASSSRSECREWSWGRSLVVFSQLPGLPIKESVPQLAGRPVFARGRSRCRPGCHTVAFACRHMAVADWSRCSPSAGGNRCGRVDLPARPFRRWPVGNFVDSWPEWLWQPSPPQSRPTCFSGMWRHFVRSTRGFSVDSTTVGWARGAGRCFHTLPCRYRRPGGQQEAPRRAQALGMTKRRRSVSPSPG